MADVEIDTTAEFDSGTKSNTVTVTDVIGITANRLDIGIDGVDDSEISETGITNQAVVGNFGGTDYWMGQSFQPPSNAIYTAIAVGVDSVVGTPTPYYFEIRTDNGGEPSATVIAQTETIAHGDVTTGGFDTKLSLNTPIKLNSGTTYWMVYRTDGVGSSNNYYSVYYLVTGTYSDGNRVFSTDAGSSWTQRATNDMSFILYTQDTTTSGNWTNTAIQLTDQQLSQIDITTTDADASNYIDKIEILDADDSDSVLTTYAGNITTVDTTNLSAGDFDNGFDVTTDKNYKIKIYFVGEGGAVSEIEVSNISITNEGGTPVVVNPPGIQRTKVYWDAEKFGYTAPAITVTDSGLVGGTEIYTDSGATVSLITTKSFGYGINSLKIEGMASGSAVYIMPSGLAETDYKTFSIRINDTASVVTDTDIAVQSMDTDFAFSSSAGTYSDIGGNWYEYQDITTHDEVNGWQVIALDDITSSDVLYIDFINATPTASDSGLIFDNFGLQVQNGVGQSLTNVPNWGSFGHYQTSLAGVIFGDPATTVAFFDATPPQCLLIEDEFITATFIPTGRSLKYTNDEYGNVAQMSVGLVQVVAD